MSITVKIMKRTAEGRPALYASRDLDVLPATIGRDAACTIALEDPHKHMSRFHVEITQEDGAYWMSVVSKVNPVMVKGRRYGPGTRLTLQSGDSFELAEYEVQVVLPQADPQPTEPLTTPASAPADDAERLFNEVTFLGGEAKQEPPPEETFIPQKAPAPTHPLRAFLEGAGVPHKELPPAHAERMLRDCGAVLRAAVEGVMTLILARAEMRKQFETQKDAPPRDHNPMKRMANPGEALDFLFDCGERTEGLLDPVQAMVEACEDLRAHELAMMAGMRAAVLGALRQFEPQALESAYERSAQGFSLASRKAKLWDLFAATQERLAREAQADFAGVFGRDFMSAYQAELERLKGER